MNEYIGNNYRLIVTPLIYKSCISILTAFNYCLGASLQGPAGVGKTELVKDLSKTFAYSLIIFNCSQNVKTESFTMILKGIASSGVWCCLDEFNRTSVEVVSTISGQISTLL